MKKRQETISYPRKLTPGDINEINKIRKLWGISILTKTENKCAMCDTIFTDATTRSPWCGHCKILVGRLSGGVDDMAAREE